MIRLSIDMRTIAVFYGLAVGRWWGYYLAGYDRPWAGRIHLGQITLAERDRPRHAGRRRGIRLPQRRRAGQVSLAGSRTLLDGRGRLVAPPGTQFQAVRSTRDATAALVKSARSILSA